MNRDGTNQLCTFIPNLDPIRGGGHPSVRGSDNLLLVQNFLDNADGGLYTLDYDTLQNRQKIPNTIGRDLSPAWSNDGQKIAFAAFPTNRGEPYFFTNLFKINPDGSSRTQLTNFTQPFGEGFSYSLIWTLDNYDDYQRRANSMASPEFTRLRRTAAAQFRKFRSRPAPRPNGSAASRPSIPNSKSHRSAAAFDERRKLHAR